MTLNYTTLLNYLRRGVRNGNWRKLNRLERATYRAALTYTKIKGKIVNNTLVTILLKLIDKLRETPMIKILRAGLNRAKMMKEKFKENNVYNWCPQAKKWFSNPAYIMWLGLTEGIYNLMANQ
ncbi:MAG TPA: hypothetical protein ENG81_02265 [Candidatus Bathyarchaeota archaeon]|nr:hypothetical protein [Candidatus Bathyarchaeota archaeon]